MDASPHQDNPSGPQQGVPNCPLFELLGNKFSNPSTISSRSRSPSPVITPKMPRWLLETAETNMNAWEECAQCGFMIDIPIRVSIFGGSGMNKDRAETEAETDNVKNNKSVRPTGTQKGKRGIYTKE